MHILTCVCDKQMHSVGHDFDDASIICEFHKHPTVVIAMMSSQVLLYISRCLTQKSFQLQYIEYTEKKTEIKKYSKIENL